ncbi:MAG: hydroxymethylglutaryl-CoA lyase [Saprospiraceae bacterium]|nr:hydroxymethylglutaryl-CoA lyase [Saprospiraceae bacterium]MDW8228220.1 hydroxymethylglutaryl-CoA lyase [Saprospiraceae bacterium]
MTTPEVILEEQGLRDGLQTLKIIIPTEKKLEWIDRLVGAGLRRLQVTSFVHPGLVPQMADAEALFQQLHKREGVVYSALVLNRKGVERAIAAGAEHLAISVSASDTHSQKNTRMRLEEAKADFRQNMRLARSHGIRVRAGIQCAFGCRYEGAIPAERVLDLIRHHLDAGADEIALADSTGMAHPVQIRSLVAHALELCGAVPLALHLHNTENKGLANLFAAYEMGVRQFDTAFGGLGGCPFIPDATGNIATEDTVHFFRQMGVETGIDLEKVAAISREVEALTNAHLSGALYKLSAQAPML